MTSYKILFLALVLTISLAESDVEEMDKLEETEEVEELILGGKDAKRGAFPYQVAIARNDFYICGGALISNKYVVSAAHCFFRYHQANIYFVYLGSIYLMEGTKREARRLKIHPDFDRNTLRNDIALLKIDEVPFSNDIKSVDLPDSNNDCLNAQAIISGWGVLNQQDEKSTILQYTKLKVLRNEVCKQLITKLDEPETNICAGDLYRGSTPCKGDSGSPLVDGETKVLIGVVSFGDSASNCDRQTATGFTRISSYRKWIQFEIKNMYVPMSF